MIKAAVNRAPDKQFKVNKLGNVVCNRVKRDDITNMASQDGRKASDRVDGVAMISGPDKEVIVGPKKYRGSADSVWDTRKRMWHTQTRSGD